MKKRIVVLTMLREAPHQGEQTHLQNPAAPVPQTPEL